MYSTAEMMDGCKYSIEMIIVPLKGRITEINQTTAGKITERS